jgi:ATP-dependent DNA ligase
MLPTLVDEPPDGGDRIHEVKHDGYRSQIILESGSARVFTRRGHDWTAKYRLIAEAGELLPDS